MRVGDHADARTLARLDHGRPPRRDGPPSYYRGGPQRHTPRRRRSRNLRTTSRLASPRRGYDARTTPPDRPARRGATSGGRHGDQAQREDPGGEEAGDEAGAEKPAKKAATPAAKKAAAQAGAKPAAEAGATAAVGEGGRRAGRPVGGRPGGAGAGPAAGVRKPAAKKPAAKKAAPAPAKRRHRARGGRLAARLSGAEAHLSLEERQATGKAQRAAVPLEALGAWEPKPDRADPLAILTAQETDRLQPLLPVRHARMLQNAFGFYRGAPAVMAADLAAGPRTDLEVQLCGDAHLLNFGLYGSPGALAGLRRQRLRRDAAGPVRVGREAAHRQPRRRRPRQRPRQEEGAGHRARERPLLPRLHAPVRRHGHADDLVHADERRQGHRRHPRPGAPGRRREDRRTGDQPRRRPGRRQADRRAGREARPSSRSRRSSSRSATCRRASTSATSTAACA